MSIKKVDDVTVTLLSLVYATDATDFYLIRKLATSYIKFNYHQITRKKFDEPSVFTEKNQR